MTIKNCYILDNSRGFVFYGALDKSLEGTPGYNFYEVKANKKDKKHKKEMDKLELDLKYGKSKNI